MAANISESAKQPCSRHAGQIELAERLAVVGFWEWDLIADCLTYCSAGYARIMGMTREECLEDSANSDKDLLSVHPDDQQRYRDAENRGCASGEGVDIEYRVISPNGSIRYIHEISEVTKDASGELIRASGTIQDITERRVAAEQLWEAERKSRAWLEHSPACTKIVDLDFNLQYMSNAGVRGLRIDDITPFYGKPYPFDFYPKAFRDKMIENLQWVKETGEITTQEASVVDVDGNDVWFHSTLVPVNDDDGHIDYIMVVSIDVTERKRLNQELIRMEKLESIGILAGGIAHDLNNLLTSVVGNLSLARMCEDAADKDSKIEDAERASLHLEALSKQLLTFSKGGLPIRQRVELGKLLRGWVTFPLRGSNVTSEYLIASDLWDVNIDEGQINQVITNLVINAKQSMRHGGVIQLTADNVRLEKDAIGTLEAGSYVTIAVHDEGEGIPKEIQHQIFDPFFSTKKAGSGLGLATSHSIVEKHDGCISVESSPGVGSTFTLYLPMAKGKKLVQSKREDADALVGDGRVLLMDDDEMIRELVVDSLARLGYTATTTRNDVETITAYRKAFDSETPFDLVILDLTIPGGDGGREVIRQIKQIDPNVKAIVCSGYSTDPVMANFCDYGFKGRISKPFRIKELAKTVRAVLKETEIP